MQVTIVGAGIMGLSTAWALLRRGHRVTVVEQYAIPNPLGSSVDDHRLIRYPYGAAAGYCRMVAGAYGAWGRLWTDLGRPFYRETGTLVVGAAGSAWMDASAALLAEMGMPPEWLDAAGLVQRFPLLRLDPGEHGFHLPSGGALFAERIVAALAAWLDRRGATLLPNSRAAAIVPDRAGLILADGRRIEADRLVVAAGAWVTRLLPGLAARVRPTRQTVCYLRPPGDRMAAWTRMPMVLDIDQEHGIYVVPPVGGTGLKIGDHVWGPSTDPDRDREPHPEESAAVCALGKRRIAHFDLYRLASARTCFYTVDAEERFVVEPVDGATWMVGACSGHGFKFGAMMGEEVADALEERRPAAAIADRAAGRLP
jgi:glycine/D-amino acid oxidase-like deaminating enzyme